ncbi:MULTISPECIES: pantoate--beta-alanine ligase [Microbacterium]|uniref:pantoate--beta-alanine ligase n=1 Tax=Microbacterium TaxID=33882 RepID=UPI00217DC3DC|nr:MULTISPECIES: pantoate--beta-alanine ligase [Microbacterium]UWF77534.1 pantoate--beta-alanine ligase [Microbacterium neungamense]WCM55703.1 pantoate--beta-alanine ligase [Microbacterium sp. EF45047]
MRILRTVAEVRDAVSAARGEGRTVGFVPTMGAFHEGHLSLMRTARAAHGLVVVSLFVNPTQFNAAHDLSTYPRDEERDAALAEAEGVDILFVPSAAEMYPDGFATRIHVSGITEVLCGAYRGPEHFDGVATVVAKLFAIVAPDVAYFGRKDAQQVLVVRRLVRDLNLPVRIDACPIVREPDGLAMSSRNVRLDPESRERATALHRALAAAERAAAAGERDAGALIAAARAELAAAGVEPEYLELRDAQDLHELSHVEGEALLAVAAHVGGVRLIDNTLLRGDA